jgi:tetratricopeptide (TPR) repeat protein
MTEEDHQSGRAKSDASAALLAAALGRVSDNPRVDALIERQIALADLQIEDLKRDDALRRWSLRFANASAVMKVAFEVAIAFIVLAVAVFIAAAIWDAAHDDGLVIEAFQVPPDMTARGLTGQTVASQLLDKLSALQAATDSARPPTSYTNNWGNDIKVEIPNTGISIGEFKRYLAAWLGHETHINGEVFRDATGVTVTARVGGGDGASFHGAEADLDTLLQKAAESIYKRTQPYRYATYLMFGLSGQKATWTGAIPIFHRLAADPSPLERSWADIGLGNIERYNQSNLRASQDYFHRALEANPRLPVAFLDLSGNESNLEYEEQALGDAETMERLIQSPDPGVTGLTIDFYHTENLALIAQYRGDFAQMARISEAGKQLPAVVDDVRYFWIAAAEAAAFAHDARRAHANVGYLRPAPSEVQLRADLACAGVLIESSLENDRAVTALEPSCEAQQRKAYASYDNDTILPRDWLPFLALAKARLGGVAGGERLIAPTPLDCDLCVRVRGGIAALKHDWNGAARWFALVSARTPHIPFADNEWGRMLLAKGDLDGAVAKLESAHAKGPHFADPLELWGEALVAKNRSDLALAKFEEASKYAPNWGRLHLKWGEALMWSGRKDEAKKQFEIASRLDLSASERAEINRIQ